MVRRVVALLAVASALTGLAWPTASLASSEREPWRLKKVASAFASRAVFVKCATPKEDSILVGAWGYVWVPTGKQPFATIDLAACWGALDVATDSPRSSDFMKAIGVGVLVHEAYHLRRVEGNQDEARTECRAMRHYDVALRMLGATDSVMDRLMPLMLMQHWHLRAKYGAYNFKGCPMPLRYDRWRGYPPREG